ncbi:MAG TPA: hypothetical protein VEH52_10900 [Gaiellaceae bacterium]|nr:hypothetical protein [Gaiellaceae bacterium]
MRYRELGPSVVVGAVVVLALLALLVAGCGQGGGATLGAFSGKWVGHTRTLTIADGSAKESIYSGCCDAVIALRLRLSSPHGTPKDASATATVTAVRVLDKSAFTKTRPAPQVGETETLRLRDGVISDRLTRATYCDPAAESAGTCGA